jgi:hypothetical protein
MCYNCYHRKGRDKKAWKCEHPDKNHYALGFCQNCYHTIYKKNKPEIIKKASRNAKNRKKQQKSENAEGFDVKNLMN